MTLALTSISSMRNSQVASSRRSVDSTSERAPVAMRSAALSTVLSASINRTTLSLGTTATPPSCR
jgi:hypothetical protein